MDLVVCMANEEMGNLSCGCCNECGDVIGDVEE